ncbi:MAG: recJ [Gammaproteobacteria bacterium]|nr:recJ [Gammaproteobacteria bacterium]
MQKKIIKRAIETKEADFLHLHEVLQRVYLARGVKFSRELEQGLEHLLPYQSLLGIDKAVTCLYDALSQQKNILIIGDFDVDGATSTAVAIRALRSFGAKNVSFLVPNRFSFGYGLTPELVEVAAIKFTPALIVTVDNGIANHAGVIAAKARGMQVLITDHHLAAETLPPADAIVNPNQPHDPFPSKHMAGVGVIFYVMLALRRYLIDRQWFSAQGLPEPNMARLLDLVALGTVADVVALDHNNRILVHQGLQRIRAGYCVPAISALLELANRNPKRVVAADLGFVVAPRLNAAGRLDDMSLGIESLLCDELPRVREMVQVLDQLNDERRVIENDMQEQALFFLKKIQLDQKKMPRGICLFDADWHQGVIGILASRIKDRLQRPVIAFAIANETELKGSARSVSGVHIRDVLAHIATHYPGLIGKFGGHAMAAGLTLPRAVFAEFANLFDQVVAEKIEEEQLQHLLLSDGELQAHELTLEMAELLRDAGPWGQAFPEPLFEGVFHLVDQRLLGGKHLKMIVEKEEKLFEAIAFNTDINQWPNHRCEQVMLVYRMDVNEFRNKCKMQLVVEHLEVAMSESISSQKLL